MYKTGDYIICKSGGIWLVSKDDSDGIHLTEHECGTTKILSADSDEIIRTIVSKDMMLDVIGRIAFIRTIQAPNDKIRKEFYDEAMSKYDEIEWVKIIKTVYLRQKERRIISSELEYSERAKAYLHGEISVLLEIPIDEVEVHIASAVTGDIW